MRVLLVAEDVTYEPYLIQALQAVLEMWRICPARSKQQFETVLRDGSLGLIVIGYQVFWGDGLQLLREARTQRPDVPVMMVTAHGSEDIAVQGLKAGLADYLPWRNRDRLGDRVLEILAHAGQSKVTLAGMQDAGLEPFPMTSESALPDREAQGAISQGELAQEHERLLTENRQQRALLEQLVDTAPVGIAVVAGPDHCFQLVNSEYRSIPGTPDLPMVGCRLAEALPDTIVDTALALVERVYATGETASVREFRAHVGPDREETYWNVDHIPLGVDDGRPQSVLILAHDVTDEVRARLESQSLARSLKQERDILEIILDNTSTQFAYLDPEFNFVRVNGAYAEGCGYDAATLIGRNHFDFFPDEENRAIFERVRDTLEPATYRGKPFEFAGQPERGTTYWDWSLFPVVDAGRQVQGLVLSLLEVTDRELAIRQREADLVRLQHLLDVAEHVLAEHTLKGLIERVVEAARTLTGAWLGFALHRQGDDSCLVVTAGAEGRASRVRPAPGSMASTWRELEAEQGSTRLYLRDDEVRAYLAMWGVPQVPVDAGQLLGARLVGHYGETLSVVIVSGKEPRGFTDTDGALLAQLAALTSLALQHLAAHRETDRRVAELDATISAIADGVIIYAPTGEVVRVNSAGRRILGYPDDAVLKLHAGLGRGNGTSVDGDNLLSLIRALPLARALAGETIPGTVVRIHPGSEESHTLTSDDGEHPVWLFASAAPIRGPDDLLVGAVSVFTDITELHTIQERLEEVNARLEHQTEQLRHQAEQLQARNRDLQLLNAVGRELSGTLDLTEVLDRVLGAVGQVLPVTRVAIWLVDRDNPGWLVLSAVLPPAPSTSIGRDRIRVDADTLAQLTADEQEWGSGVGEQSPSRHCWSTATGRAHDGFVVPLQSRGRTIGVIEVTDTAEEASEAEVQSVPEVHVLTTLAAWAAIAIENAMFHREAQQTAVAAERTRLASELHDAVSQLLFSAKVTAESLTRLWDTNPAAVRSGLKQLQDLTWGALAEMRTLLLELRPTALTEADLGELLKQLTQAVSSRGKMRVSLMMEGDVSSTGTPSSGRLPDDVQITFYRAAQEALNNVVKHARATHTEVCLARLPDRVTLTVTDNGRGFDPSAVPASSLGLQIMHERAASIGAQVTIDSRSGGGTRVFMDWPRNAKRGR